MDRGVIRGALALIGAAAAWRVAAEVEQERRQQHQSSEERARLGLPERRVGPPDRRSQPRSRKRRAPVRVSRPDGTVDHVELDRPATIVEQIEPRDTEGVVSHPVPKGEVPARSRPLGALRSHVGAGAAAAAAHPRLLLAASLIGVAATFWALVNPLHVGAWPAAMTGLALVVGCWALGRPSAASRYEHSRGGRAHENP